MRKQVPAGQRINVTLYEFSASAQRTSHPAAGSGKSLASITSHLSAPSAETYGQLREHNSRRHPVDIVGREATSRRPSVDTERQLHVLTTDTSALEVFTYDLPGRSDFLLTFTGTHDRTVDDEHICQFSSFHDNEPLRCGDTQYIRLRSKADGLPA